MEIAPQTSFIPKTPITSAAQYYKKPEGETSIIDFIAYFIFIITLLAGGAIFGAEYYLNSNISTLQDQLKTAVTNIKPDLVNKLSALDTRLKYSNDLLKNHIATSEILNALENYTYNSVRFTDFSFISGDKGMTVSLKGEALSYAALASQADNMVTSGIFVNPDFSDMGVSDKGLVVFTLKAGIDPKKILWSATALGGGNTKN